MLPYVCVCVTRLLSSDIIIVCCLRYGIVSNACLCYVRDYTSNNNMLTRALDTMGVSGYLMCISVSTMGYEH